MKADVAIGALLLVVSAAMFALTFTFPPQTVALSPTFFPRFITVCMAILAVTLMAKNWPRRGAAEASTPFDLAAWMRQGHVLRIATMTVVAFVYTQAVDPLGFLVATGPFLAATVVIFMERRWSVILPVAVGGTSVLYVVFRMVFKVPLPRFDLF